MIGGEVSKKVIDVEVLGRARKWGEGEKDDDIIDMEYCTAMM